MKIVSQLESTIATLQINLEYYKNIYRNSCDIDDFDESEKVAKSARENIRLFKGWIKTLESFNADVQEHQELVVCEQDVEQSNGESSTENLTTELEKLSAQLEEVISQRDELKSQLELAQQTIHSLQTKTEESPVVKDSSSVDAKTIHSTSNNDIISVFCKDSKGRYSASGEYDVKTKSLTVLQGSRINPVASFTRDKYRDIIKYVNKYVLQKDVTFDTVSDAGVFITGNAVSKSGMKVWKDANGVNLQKILSKMPMAIKNEKIENECVTNTLTEPTTQSSKISFKILEQYFSVDSYVEVYYKVLEILLIKYYFEVATLGSILKLNVKDVSLFSFNENDIRFKNIPIKRKLSNNLWVGIVDDKNTILENIDEILDACSCPKDQFKIL